MPSTFVSIAALNESMLVETCQGLLSTAVGPVTLGICLQGDPRQASALTELGARVVYSQNPQGMCKARHQAASLYEGEDYWLQIDGHMYDWVPAWDAHLIDQLGRIPGKAVLSKFPPDDEVPSILGRNQMQLLFYPTGELRGANGMWLPTRFEQRMDLDMAKDIPASVLITGCWFAPGRYLAVVGLEPGVHWEADEAVHALRTWTHGYDLFYMAPTVCRHVNRRRRPLGVVRTELSHPPSALEERLARSYMLGTPPRGMAQGMVRSRAAFFDHIGIRRR